MADAKISLFERRNFNEVFLIFFIFGRKDIVHDGKLFCLKKVGKRKVKFRRSGTLRTFARNFSNIDFFSENFTIQRS